MKARGRVLPIFYDVDPSDVRKQITFGEAFANHKERFRDDKEKVQRWRSALSEVANFSSWNSKDWYETKLIRNIIEEKLKKLQPPSFTYAVNLVGMDSRLQPVFLLLGVGMDDIRFIGIWGMGGIDVRDSVEKGGLFNLQKQLLSGMIRTKQADHKFGATIIRRLLGHKKNEYPQELHDIYYELEFSFKPPSQWEGEFDEGMVQVKKCGVRLINEDDVEELWQTVLKQTNTKRGLELSDDDDDAASTSASQAHPKRFKLHLEGAGPSGSPKISSLRMNS
ncbi:hypothetical protein ACLB2K_017107 [Fragaria x ananassa]